MVIVTLANASRFVSCEIEISNTVHGLPEGNEPCTIETLILDGKIIIRIMVKHIYSKSTERSSNVFVRRLGPVFPLSFLGCFVVYRENSASDCRLTVRGEGSAKTRSATEKLYR